MIVQILILTIFVSTGNDDVNTNSIDITSLPIQTKVQQYYTQLSQSGNCFTKDHHWLKNGNGHIQLGISYFLVEALGDGVRYVYPAKAIGDVFYKGDLLAEIEGVSGNHEFRAPCDGILKGINPLIENPLNMSPSQMWFFKCELKRDQLGSLMDDQEYANAIK